MKTRTKHEKGTVLVMVAMLMLALLGFSALGMEAGRWFLVRAELSKSVDAAALLAAKNISNPYVSPTQIATQFFRANFPVGYLGTPASGAGSANFTVNVDPATNKVTVNGNVSAVAILAQILGFNLIPVNSMGVAQKKEVEIILVLDRSGSMNQNNAMPELKKAAALFVNYFKATQTTDRLGMISFSTTPSFDQPLGTNYVTPLIGGSYPPTIGGKIGAMTPSDYTNSEDAIDQADGPGGFTNQGGIPGDQRIQQFLIFFSDGWPTAFRGNFVYKNVTYDAVLKLAGECGVSTPNINSQLQKPVAPDGPISPTINPNVTGPGIATTTINCNGTTAATVHWLLLDQYPVPGYSSTAQCIPSSALKPWACELANGLASIKAQELKAKGVKIYTIGLGDDNPTMMTDVASGPTFYKHAPTPTELQALFQLVAREIALRLVQ